MPLRLLRAEVLPGEQAGQVRGVGALRGAPEQG